MEQPSLYACAVTCFLCLLVNISAAQQSFEIRPVTHAWGQFRHAYSACVYKSATHPGNRTCQLVVHGVSCDGEEGCVTQDVVKVSTVAAGPSGHEYDPIPYTAGKALFELGCSDRNLYILVKSVTYIVPRKLENYCTEFSTSSGQCDDITSLYSCKLRYCDIHFPTRPSDMCNFTDSTITKNISDHCIKFRGDCELEIPRIPVPGYGGCVTGYDRKLGDLCGGNYSVCYPRWVEVSYICSSDVNALTGRTSSTSSALLSLSISLLLLLLFH